MYKSSYMLILLHALQAATSRVQLLHIPTHEAATVLRYFSCSNYLCRATGVYTDCFCNK